MLTLIRVKKYLITLGFVILLATLGQHHAYALNLPDVPLLVFSNVEHNVLLTFDDSGSMERGYLPDNISGDGSTRRACSSTYNNLAYDPTVTYTPPPVRNYPGNLSATAANLPDANFTAAPVNGYIPGSTTINLSTAGTSTAPGYKPVWEMNVLSSTLSANSSYASCTQAATSGNGVAAFYYVYDIALAGTGGCPTTPVTTDDDCYRLVQHGNAAAGGSWSTAQQTNFANWYSYYRVRNLAAKAAAGRAFRGFATNIRIAGHLLNNPGATAGPASGITFTNTTSTNTTNVMKRFCDDTLGIDSLCADGSTARTDFFTRLYNTGTGTSTAIFTPLRAAMQRAGNSFGAGNNGNYSPYRSIPGVAPSTTNPNPELSCRKNFHIMMTDGYWNNAAGVAGDIDSVGHTLGDGTTTYTAQPPYSETPTRAGTLADNAFEYWYQDLRSDLTNNVRHFIAVGTGPGNLPWDPANLPWDPRNNPATWQHMQTFTIGLGLTGTRNPENYFNTALAASAGDWDELLSGSLSWPNPLDGPTYGDADRIDDLWHAAVNGRGRYFSAKNPDDLINAFTQIIGQINVTSGSGAGLGASGSTTSGGTSVFQVAYGGTWTGRLMSIRVDTNGFPQSINWEAGNAGLNTQNYLPSGTNGRNIFTYNPTNTLGNRGVPFQWSSLTTTQQAALNTSPSNVVDTNGPARLDYLRGASANEGTGLGFRVRTCYNASTLPSGSEPSPMSACPPNVGKLGDIIDSAPVYVAKPDFGYPDTLESTPYSTFVKDPLGSGGTSGSTRTPMIYVGANDGMLHGFRASDGIELMAYVPNLVYTSDTNTNNLSLLTSPFYSHRYYVDGTPTVGDVYTGGAWRTVLVGGLRKGGRGYYALDITKPANFSEGATNAQQLVKWEFTDPDLGYSFSQATIVKMATGQWAAIFGNGYNNTGTGRSMIFIVDIATGNLIQKIDTGTCAITPCGGGTLANPNGMATPAVVDMNDDYIADYIYAGDLLGKMWRIDVRSSTASNWSLAANVMPLFTAVDPLGAVQPITTKPAVGFHPSGFGGLMVYFGTGKYLENDDNAATGTQQTQTFYGIYDRGVTGRGTEPSRLAPVVQADLLLQTIDTTIGTVTRTSPPETFSTRNISNNSINWRLDRTSTNTHLGWYVNLPTPAERQVTDPLLREGRIIFTTLIPGTDACAPGGTGWLMELNSANGGRLDETLDLNGDGIFSSLDNGGAAYGAAGAKTSSGGSLSSPIVLTNPPSGPPPAGPRYSETKLAVTSAGDIVTMKESGKPNAPEAWRQLK